MIAFVIVSFLFISNQVYPKPTYLAYYIHWTWEIVSIECLSNLIRWFMVINVDAIKMSQRKAIWVNLSH